MNIHEFIPIITDKALWKNIEELQGEVFITAKGLKYSYHVKGGEIFVNRKEKSITKATVLIAYRKVKELFGIVSGPKQLGVFGASYLFPVFLRLGIIQKT